MSNERPTRTYRPPPPPASAEPEHIRDILAPIVTELEERLRRRSGVRHFVELALEMQRAGVEGFADVSALDLALELLGLGRDSDDVLGDLYVERREVLP